ncbi:hypothetical protein D7Y13_26595 [Corallococcus praedator]|uniref:Glycosyltransferase RgtA/B/C/D-like domain-containing protein n=1 Tax=Corallococcus praedator TaxID=2316724 RepID=A0ABX9QBT6_9BACT|nr:MULTISPECIES: hypothetical protein [Corallococcus]RKH24042.1 hypothetical protein D7X75_32650 [Corallococcus sp. CA031C]RKI00688.1 hypothetical protein D7Y13_26595 [Corallococcus praedator]
MAAALLGAMTLHAGFMFDDYVWLGIWDRVPQPAPLANTPFDVYRTATGVAEHTHRMSESGIFPWWVEPTVKLAFFRPLSSALFGLDHALFGRDSVGYHAHSLLWYVGLVMLAGLLFRRVLPAAVAALAMFLFAINGSHAAVLGWLSYRALMVSTLFGVLGFWLHLEWRERQRKGALVGSLVAFALGLASAETMLILIPYVIAYEAFAGPGKAADKLKGLLPLGVLLAGYFALYKSLGYGAAGQDTHVDPLGAPGAWVSAMISRVPAAIAGLTLSAPSDYIMDASYVPVFTLIGAAGLAFFALLVWGVWPRLEGDERRTLKWMLTGSFVATFLASSALAGTRTLLVPSLGLAVGLAMVLRAAWRGRARSFRAGAVLAGAAVMFLLHVVAAPYVWWQTVNVYTQMDAMMNRAQARYGEALDVKALPNQRVVVLNAPSGVIGIYSSVQWWSLGKTLPKAWWVLSYAMEPQQVTRTGPNSLELSLPKGHLLTTIEERVYRGSRYPLAVGDTFDVKGMKVRVEDVDAEGPKRVSFTFDVPLEDPSLKFVEWKNKKVLPWTPPALNAAPVVVDAHTFQ